MTEAEIKAFLTVVNLGSVTAAAKELYLTQPALSRRLHASAADEGTESGKR